MKWGVMSGCKIEFFSNYSDGSRSIQVNFPRGVKSMTWCPECDQGEISRAKIKGTGEEILVCDECEGVWLRKADIGTSRATNLSDYLKERNINVSWSALEF